MQISVWYHYSSAWRASFSIFYSLGLLEINFFQLCYVWKSPYFTFIFETYFWWEKISKLAFFSFSTLKMLLKQSLLSCIVFNKKVAVILISFFPLYIVFLYSTSTFKSFLFITGRKQINHDMPWWSFLQISCPGSSLSFLELWIYNFFQI